MTRSKMSLKKRDFQRSSKVSKKPRNKRNKRRKKRRNGKK